jgi:hypothetical protein
MCHHRGCTAFWCIFRGGLRAAQGQNIGTLTGAEPELATI